MEAIPANTRPLDGPPPRLNVPPGATDCHMHVFLDGFCAQPGGPPIAELATVEDYAIVRKRLGLERVVITQPNAYQFDNGATLAGLERIGKERARAVIVVSPGMSVAELEELDRRGVRGARIMNLPGGAVTIAEMEPVEKLAREVGWHLIVQFNGNEIDRHIDALRSIETDYVIDHIGKFMPPVAAEDRKIDEILRLIDRGNAWFKIAGINESSLTGGPAFADVAAIARRVIAYAPDRVLWGSNWPHLGAPRTAYPDDAAFLDLLLDWTDADTIRKILVDNPARLYRFDA
ncbi:MAG TPA: amidohydrolase family protein [Rhizobiaceae bacterium]|nr:amidohydrolase family protein [Rhizobiaceae bacterium]